MLWNTAGSKKSLKRQSLWLFLHESEINVATTNTNIAITISNQREKNYRRNLRPLALSQGQSPARKKATKFQTLFFSVRSFRDGTWKSPSPFPSKWACVVTHRTKQNVFNRHFYPIAILSFKIHWKLFEY